MNKQDEVIVHTDLERDLGVDSVIEMIKRHCAEITHPYLDELKPFFERAELVSHFSRLTEMSDMFSGKGRVTQNTARRIEGLKNLEIGNFVLEVSDLSVLRDNFRLVGEIMGFFRENEQYPALRCTFTELFIGEEISKRLSRLLNQYGELRDDATPELRQVRNEIRSLSSELEKFYQHYFRNHDFTDMFQDKIITVRNGRKVVLVKKEFKHKFPGVIHDESASRESVFMEPLEALQMNNNLRELELSEEREIRRILLEFTDYLRSHQAELARNQELLAYWELLQGLTSYLWSVKAVIPQMTDRKGVTLLEAVHPLIKGNPVPQNLYLGEKYKILVLSGPNAGGKTVALKTFGLQSYLGLSGIPVNAKQAELGFFDEVLIDIGDRQSIENSLSTFSAHLVRIRQILEKVTADSLVLIDEIGAGSSPDESQALSCALLEELADRGCLAVVTTHYRQVIELAETRAEICNASLHFDILSLEPTYRIIYGEPGFSFGLVMAEKYGLPAKIVSRAKSLLEVDLIDYQAKVTELKEKLSNLAQMEREKDLELKKAEELRLKLEQELGELKKTEKKRIADLMSRKEVELDRVLEELRLELEIVAESKGKGEHILRGKVKQAREQLRREADVLPHPRELETGLMVKIRNVTSPGEIVGISGEMLDVLVENLKFQCARNDVLEILGKKDKPLGFSDGTGLLRKKMSFRGNLDVRGKRVEEAIEMVRSLLSDAVAVDGRKVEIIHGVGEMILRRAIWDYLGEDRTVKRFYEAPLGEGGKGKTIVEL
ncbi:MAG: Smr/MutS family protein [Candidatus Wallbacteria bacterium]|nr:Smr/MutS family protein [Candidatus Wallbacteria bacterium]